jgi:formylglycine-generating enzyme required for sulfatase activity
MGGSDAPDLHGIELDGAGERLVVLSPFFLERDEVTVRAFRSGGVATREDPIRSSPGEWAECTYSNAPGAQEEFAVNCLLWPTALAHCSGRGRTLPTEAQLEYAGGGRRGSRFVWGEDEPACLDAVFSRTKTLALEGGRNCSDLGLGPASIRTGTRDRLQLGADAVHDLAGSVSEWALDAWAPDGGPCWPGGILVDPVCTPERTGSGAARSYHGGSYAGPSGLLRAQIRQRIPDIDVYSMPSLGFRCARPGR